MSWGADALAAALAGCAAWLAVSRPATARRLFEHVVRAPSGGRTVARGLFLVVSGLATVGVTYRVAGPGGSVLATAGLVVASAVSGQWRARRAHHQWALGRDEVARACAALAAQLRVGRVPEEAVRLCADDHAVLVRAARAVAVGADPAAVWSFQSGEPGHEGLQELAQGWAVARRSGAPLAGTLERVAEVVDQEQRLHRVVAGEVAAPRATGKVMAALPVLALALGFAIGGNPLAFLIRQPAGWACLLAGICLAACGVAWIERLARRAERR